MTIEYKDSKRIVALSSDWTADVTSNITWSTTGKVGYNISGTTISRTGSAGWSTSKIQSTDTFTVGDGAFMIEFSGNADDNNSTQLGLNTGTLGYHYGSGSPQNNCDFAIYMAGGSQVEVYESGTKNYDSGGSRSASDRYRIEVSNSGVVKYYLQAGGTGSWVLKHTSSSTASGTYFIQANSYADTSVATVHSKTLFDTVVAKPTDVQDNSLLVEKDTARRYWFDANPLLDDNFSTDDWTDSGANVGISSGVMNFDIDRTTTDQSSYYQLSRALSDTKWTMRLHDVIVTTKSGGVEVFIGVSSNISGAQTAQDFIGLNLGDNTANPVLGGVDSDGAVIARLAGDYTYSLSTTYNIEIIRESATSYRIKVFSNSGFDSTALFSQSYTCTATTTGLQYVKFANGQVAGSTENIIGTCSKVEIFDGVTTASGGGTWTMQPTIEDDFSTDKGWVSSGAQAKIDSSGYLLFDDDSDGSAHKIYYDIGRTLDDTKWLWRFKLTTNTFSMNTDPTPQIVHMRISNKTDHRDSATEDAIGMSFRTSDGNQEYIRTTYSDGITFGTTGNFSTDMATGTHYVQITRDSSTQFTVKLYSDSSYSSLVESNSVTIPSTITGLRYLKIDNMTSDGTSNGRMIFHIDDMEVYSGVTSKN